MTLTQLKRVRWLVRLMLGLGVAASVSANILHAERNPISEVIAAWPPLALLLTIELVSRVPVYRRRVAWIRRLATTAIALIAAWVSYGHMVGVAQRYGEHGASPWLEPLSVDGLVVVASVSLVELAGRIRDLTQAAEQDTDEPLVAAEEPVEQLAEPAPEPLADEPSNERSPKPTKSTPRIARARKRNPAASQQEVATKTNLSLATVRRQWALTEPPTETRDGANGVAVPELLRTTD